jgi:predicted ATPase/class 3 adenylate cyclase
MTAPSGTVTFLFTDIEESTRLWRADPVAMRAALFRHDELLRDVIKAHGGLLFKSLGDVVAAAFPSPSGAVMAAMSAQGELRTEPWPTIEPLRVRMGVHTGEAEQRSGDYFGTTLNQAARLMAIAHEGQTLVSGTTAALVEQAVPWVDLGEHRLKDVDRPMRVFQVGDEAFPSLRSLDTFPGNLPVQLSSFVGREEELARVAKAVGETRLVTLVGVGGVGKTRLALQVAADVMPGFPDGAWLVELAPVRDPARVADAFAGAFRVTARPGLSVEDSLVAFLHDQKLLIVVDNCEHLLRPTAALVARIEQSCPGVRVLATSREGVNLRGEQMIMVPSLDLPPEGASVETVAGSEAARLFTDRARAVKADFVVDAANAAGVAEVCTRLDGVALAIELAAARIQSLTPSELAGRLGRRFQLLTGGDRLTVERHQTLRATIDWSYDLCSQDEQRLPGRLSVFAGGATLEAVEAVCGFPPLDQQEVIDLLANLVARSLAVADQTATDTRYRLQETIRQYAQERLGDSEEAELLRCRHADYFIQFAATATPRVFGPGEIEWARRIAMERDNFHAAMSFALQRQDLDRVMGLICELPTHNYQMERLIVFDPHPVLSLPGASDHPGLGRVLWEAADRASVVNDFDRGQSYLQEAEAAVRRLGPSPGYLDVITLNMTLHQDMSDLRGFSEICLAKAQHELEGGRLATAAFALAGHVGGLAWDQPAAGGGNGYPRSRVGSTLGHAERNRREPGVPSHRPGSHRPRNRQKVAIGRGHKRNGELDAPADRVHCSSATRRMGSPASTRPKALLVGQTVRGRGPGDTSPSVQLCCQSALIARPGRGGRIARRGSRSQPSDIRRKLAPKRGAARSRIGRSDPALHGGPFRRLSAPCPTRLHGNRGAVDWRGQNARIACEGSSHGPQPGL